VLTTAGEKVH